MNKQTKFKDTEIGKIPEDWDVKKLGELGELKNGVNFNRGDFGKGLPVINVTNLFRGRYATIENLDQIKKESIPNYQKYLVKAGDILFARSSLVHSGAGQAAMVRNPSKEEFLFSGFIIRFRKFEDIVLDSEFLNYLVRSELYRKYFTRLLDGTTITNINQQILSDIPITLPPTIEQQSIVKILSALDTKIETNRSMNATLESIAQTLFKHWFVDFEFPDEKGKPYKSSGGEMVESELGMVPKGWKITTFRDIVGVMGGSTPDTKNPAYWNGEIPWITPKEITHSNGVHFTKVERYITEEGMKNGPRELVPTGSVLLTSRAPVGEVGLNEIPMAINQGFIGIIPSEKINRFFIYFWIKINQELLLANANGTTFQELSKSTFKQIKLILPEKSAMNLFEKIIAPIDKQILKNENESEILSMIRDSLLPKLMSGEIRVPVGVKK